MLNETLGRAITAQKADLAQHSVAEQWARHPDFEARYGERGRAKCVQDVQYHLEYLAQAINSNSPPLLLTYIDWLKALFLGLNIPIPELAESLTITGEVLQQRFPGAAAALIQIFVAQGLEQLARPPIHPASSFDASQPLSAVAQRYLDALRRGERSVGSQLILEAVAQGASVRDIYLYIFQPSQHEIGRLWQVNQMTVAEEHYCTAATQLIMSQFYPQIFTTAKNGRRLVATGVGGELHEIGLRMVADFFEMDGWDTYYLGSNLPAAAVVTALATRHADVLAISATMVFHVQLVADLITQVRAAATNQRLQILAGGYPFNIEPNLWRQVGADGSASNALQAVALANAWLAA